MHSSSCSLKPFRFTSRAFASSALTTMRRFEARLGDLDQFTLPVATRARMEKAAAAAARRHQRGGAAGNSRRARKSQQQLTTSSAASDASPPTASSSYQSHLSAMATAAYESGEGLSVADRIARLYSTQISANEQRLRDLRRAELALIGSMHAQSARENNRTWDALNEDGVYNFRALQRDMGHQFDRKELRVVREEEIRGGGGDSLHDSLDGYTHVGFGGPQPLICAPSSVSSAANAVPPAYNTSRFSLSDVDVGSTRGRAAKKKQQKIAADDFSTAADSYVVADTTALERQHHHQYAAVCACKVAAATAEKTAAALTRAVRKQRRGEKLMQTMAATKGRRAATAVAGDLKCNVSTTEGALSRVDAVLSGGSKGNAQLKAKVGKSVKTDIPLMTSSPSSSSLATSAVSDDVSEKITTAALIHPLMALPLVLPFAFTPHQPMLLENVVNPSIVAAVKESQSLQEEAATRSRRRLAKALRETPHRRIAEVLSDALGGGGGELMDRISAKLKKAKRAASASASKPAAAGKAVSKASSTAAGRAKAGDKKKVRDRSVIKSRFPFE